MNKPAFNPDPMPHGRVNLPALRDATHRELAVYDPYLNPQLPDDEIDLREIWRIVAKYRWTIIIFTLLVVTTVAFANLLMRPVYQSTATIELNPDTDLVRLDNVEGQNWRPFDEIAKTQINVIKSESVAAAVLDRLNLWDDPELSGKITQRGVMNGVNRLKSLVLGKDGFIRKWLPSPQDGSDNVTHGVNLNPEDVARRTTLGRFAERLSVEPIRQSFLIEVSFQSFGRQVAADVANAVIEEYQRLSSQRKLGSTAGARAFLDEQIAEIQGKLETSEKELTEFARKNGIVDLEDSDNVLNERLAELYSQLTSVQGDRIEAETLYRQAQAGDIDAMPAVLDRSLIDELKNEYVTMQAEYFRLSQVFKDTYPKVQQLKAQMAQIEAALDSETRKVIRSLKLEFTQLAEKEKMLATAVEQQKADLLDIKDRSIQYNILKREWETNRELYSGLLEKKKEVGVAAGIERSNISVVDHAAVPIHPAKPRKTRNVAMAGVLGLFGGLGLAFLLGYLDNTFRLTEDMERILHVPGLGVIPKIEGRESMDRNHIGVLSIVNRSHEVSEAVRTIRTSLMFSSAGGAPKRILITSATSEEGKSTFASNLAVTMAQNGASVLLINADLRRPVLHEIFNIPAEPGLSDYLVGANKKVVYRTAVEGLVIIPCGVIPPHPTELVGSIQMNELLRKVSDEFDHVIIEAPPILGLADSLVLSSHVDGVVLMVASGTTSKDAVRDAVKRLRTIHAPLLGTVLNMVDTKSHEYGYYSRYYYGTEEKSSKGRRKGKRRAA